MVKGVIYILTNSSFRKRVKIGFAKDLDKRVKQLNSSAAVPYSFHVFAYYNVTEELTDRKLHDLIDKLNPKLRSKEKTEDGKMRTREFFRMSPEDAYQLLECIAIISGTTNRLHPSPSNVQQRKDANKKCNTDKRGAFTFSSCGIRPGAKVYYKNDKSKVVTVVDDHRVRYGNEVASLSGLAKEWLGCEAVQGPRYFSYKGEILDDLRRRRERESLG